MKIFPSLSLAIITLIGIFVSCGPRKTNSAVVEDAGKNSPSSVEELRKNTLAVVKDVVYPSEGFAVTDFKYRYFGRIGHRDRSFREDTLSFPPIPGLVHKSVYAMCPADTCIAEYATLALRCPPVRPLLDWLADTVYAFAGSCPVGRGLAGFEGRTFDAPKKHFRSAEEICEYYMGRLRRACDHWHCARDGEPDAINEQAGLLMADCWSAGDLYTFYRSDWYDFMSCGYNIRESWQTVDAVTGKPLGMEDIIVSEKEDSLAVLMMRRLVNGNGEHFVHNRRCDPSEYTDILHQADGCALIKEGLIIYFYPYNLGAGASGEYEAVIPYDELEDILQSKVAAEIRERTAHMAPNAASASERYARKIELGEPAV